VLIAIGVGLCLGLVFYFVFAPYNLTGFQMVQIVFVLLATCTAIAVVVHKIRERIADPEEFLESLKIKKEDEE
jgi:hypothetical protein